MSATPVTYVRVFDFEDWSTNHPTEPQPGVQLEAEFDAIKASLDSTQGRLAEIQRDDGALNNAIVTLDTLSPAVLAAFEGDWNIRGAWASATAYAVLDIVTDNNTTWLCHTAHTSGVSFDATKFVAIAHDADAILVAANNLSDLDDPEAARDNLELGTAALKDTGTAAGQVPLSGDLGAHAFLTPSAALAAQITARTAATVRSDLGLGDASTKTVGTTTGTVPLSDNVIGKQTVAVPAYGMTPRTTNGAAPGVSETTTNKIMVNTLDYDASTQEYAQFQMHMPEGWNEGTVSARFRWTAGSGSDNVIWGIQAVALSDDDALDTAFGTAVEVTDTLLLANDVHLTDETGAMTIGNSPGARDLVIFQVYRKAADAGDTLAVDAKLLGVDLYYTTANGVDA